MGALNISTIPCDFSTLICRITVPAPSAALVFLNPLSSSGNGIVATLLEKTFATTRSTRTRNTVTVDFGVMATSNGENGRSRRLGSTSEGTRKKKVNSGACGGRIRERLLEGQALMLLVWLSAFVISNF